MTTVEGPNGAAEVYADRSTMPRYEVCIKDVVRSYQAEGEASIEAIGLAGA